MSLQKNKFTHECNNHEYNNDCVKVKDKYTNCMVCEKLLNKKIYVRYCGGNPHIPDMYKSALDQFSDINWKRNRTEIRTVKIKLINTSYEYSYKNEPEWIFKFKVIR